MGPDTSPRELSPLRLPRIADEPLVSVIISNFNYARFLAEAVESVLRQSYQHFEIVICDDGSIDDSHTVIQRLQRLDRRVRALFQANAGQAAAWNNAIAAARGEILCFLDPDDLFKAEKLASVVDAFLLHPATGLCIHRLQAISVSGQSINRPFPHELDSGWLAEKAMSHEFWGSWPATSGISLRRGAIERVLPISSVLKRGFCDAYLCGCAQFVTEIVALDDPLTLYRLHDANTGSTPRLTTAIVAHRVEYTALTVEGIRGFVERSLGPEVTQLISLDRLRNRWFWENWLLLYIVDDQFRTQAPRADVNAALKHVSPKWRRIIWHTLLFLPPTIASRLLGLWWGNRPWKRLLQQLPLRDSNRMRSRATTSIQGNAGDRSVVWRRKVYPPDA